PWAARPAVRRPRAFGDLPQRAERRGCGDHHATAERWRARRTPPATAESLSMGPTALIADDEPKLAQDLAQRLKQLWSELEIVALVPNGIQAVAELNRLRPDYAFLDIRMPGLSGLEAA